MSRDRKRSRNNNSCYMCRQPVTEDYRFTLSWSEKGEEETRTFCGSRCLKDWVDKYSEDVKLELFDSDDAFMFRNVSAANLRACDGCGEMFASNIQECTRCEKK